MEDKDVEFSIASGSNEEMLFGCLESLRSTMKDSSYVWSITVTCNTPGTSLPGRLKARYPDVGVLEGGTGAGAAASHNRVIRLTRARYVWLLNDDLMMLPEAVQRVTEFMERPQNSRVGLVSPRLLDPDGAVQVSAHVFPSMVQILLEQAGFGGAGATRSLHRKPIPSGSRSDLPNSSGPSLVSEVDTLHGACVAVRTKAARQVGPMLETHVVGGEET